MIAKRVRWMVAGGAVTLVVKARAQRAIGVEADRLAARVPPAGPVLDRLAPEVARAAGAAIVAGRTARLGGRAGYRAAVVGGRGARTAGGAAVVAGQVATQAGLSAQEVLRRARHGLDTTAAAWQAARREEERQLRADLARLHGDGTAAIDALLDRRPPPPDDERTAVPAVPPPVAPGRPRPAVAGLAAPAVSRVQRSYRGPSRPWSRPAR